MLRFVPHRIADPRIPRLIRKWLTAGVGEDGAWSETRIFQTKKGTPQGAVISPLLANIYLHYVYDLRLEVWREKVAKGEVITIRYADDPVVGFESRAEAERFLPEFRERLAKFGLELHPEKTRLIELGRFARQNRERRGEGEVESFTFPGFTHYCGSNGKGTFTIRRQTARKRMEAKLLEVKQTLRARMHEPVVEVGKWLKSMLADYYQYYGVPGNLESLNNFRERVARHWLPRAETAQPNRASERGPEGSVGRLLAATTASPLPLASTPDIQGRSRMRS